jgi:8-oxo-dGTP pyrophosphatase MutT (NUDIX family)
MTFSTKAAFIERVKDKLASPQADIASNLEPEDPFVLGDGSGLPVKRLRPAAVLFGLVDRGDDFGVVFTQRPKTMKAHPGQIALPGGKIEADESPAQAALREAYEEVGASLDKTELLGQLEPMRLRTGFSVSLVVGQYHDDFVPSPCPKEVDDVFETPLSFLMDPQNHERHSREFAGETRDFWAMPYQGRFIWGATAGMIKLLYEKLYT